MFKIIPVITVLSELAFDLHSLNLSFNQKDLKRGERILSQIFA